jgi:hypothetical protein
MSERVIVASPDAFGQNRVTELKESSFWLGSATPTALKSPKCHIVLFYEPASTDPELLTIWDLLAQTIAGPVIAAVNTSARTEVMEAFLGVNSDIDNPLNDFSGFGIPTILVYRNRWPQAFYNGELSYDALKKWILVLACRPGYKEPSSLFSGVEAVVPEQYVKDDRIENYAYPTSSQDFTATTGDKSGSYQEEPVDEYQDITSQDTTNQEQMYTENVSDVGYLDE